MTRKLLLYLRTAQEQVSASEPYTHTALQVAENKWFSKRYRKRTTMFSQGVLGVLQSISFSSLSTQPVCSARQPAPQPAGRHRALALPTATGCEPPLSLEAALKPKLINSRLKAAYVIFFCVESQLDLPSWRTHTNITRQVPNHRTFSHTGEITFDRHAAVKLRGASQSWPGPATLPLPLAAAAPSQGGLGPPRSSHCPPSWRPRTHLRVELG